MEITVKKLTSAEWLPLSENAHKVVFNEVRPMHFNRIDFALVMVDPNDTLLWYGTCREVDFESLYLQYGGTFPSAKKTSLSFLAYQAGIDWCKKRYQRINMLVLNTNTAMLKMAMKTGFIITGIKNFNSCVLVELSWEKEAVLELS